MLSIFPNTTFQIFQIELSMFTMFYISTNIIKYTLAPHHNKSVLLDISILSSLENADGFFLGGGSEGEWRELLFLSLLYQNIQNLKMATNKHNDWWIIDKN